MEPDVSIIVVVHNGAEYLTETISSLLAQDGELEIIIVDNGSTDNSVAIAQQFAQNSPAVKLIEQQNTGPSGGRNTGMRVATGRYLMFLDDDDALVPHSLHQVVTMADRENLDLCSFDSTPFRDPSATDGNWDKFKDYYTVTNSYERQTGLALMAQLRQQHEYRAVVWKYLISQELAKKLGTDPHLMVRRHSDELFTFAAFVAAERAAHTPIQVHRRRVRGGSLMTNATTANLTASADGYFAVYVQMLKIISALPSSLTPEVNESVAKIVNDVFLGCLRDRKLLPAKARTDLVSQYRYHDPLGVSQAIVVRDFERLQAVDRLLQLIQIDGVAKLVRAARRVSRWVSGLPQSFRWRGRTNLRNNNNRA